jgi:hypothetical protein
VQPSVDEFIEILNIVAKKQIAFINQVHSSKINNADHIDKLKSRLENDIKEIKENKFDNLRMRMYKDASKNINSKIGILSFSRRWDSSLMWAHYTVSHKGFCIGFDAEDTFFSEFKKMDDIEKIFQPVIYSSDRVQVPIIEGKEINIEVLLRKSKDWEYEEEERLILTFDQAKTKIESLPFDIHLYEVPHRLIKEIIMGANISDSNSVLIKDFCTAENIDLYQSQISETKFAMDRIKV